MRSLDLSYPERLVLNIRDGEQLPDKPAVEFHFPARGELPPVKLYWQGGGKPPAEILARMEGHEKDKKGGLMILGEKDASTPATGTPAACFAWQAKSG